MIGFRHAPLLLLALMPACAPQHFIVTKATPESKEGFRYFLPQPYLLITNMTVASTSTTVGTPGGGSVGTTTPKMRGDTATGGPKDSLPPLSVVTMQVIWLPDRSREYVVTTDGAGGSFSGALQLANGWMLTGVNQQSDSKTAETLQALSGMFGTVFSAAGLGTATARFQQGPAPAAVRPVPFLLLFRINGDTLVEVSTKGLNALLKAEMSNAPDK